MHDPRVGRFFARDPLAVMFPHNSPYAFSENRVIDGVELEGLEVTPYVNKFNTSYPVFTENAGNVIQRANNAVSNIGGFALNVTGVTMYNTSSALINGAYNLFTGKYNETIKYLPTEIDRGLNNLSNDISDAWDDLKGHTAKEIGSSTLNSFTTLENYELAAELFIWHKATTIKGSGSSGVVSGGIISQRQNLAKSFYEKFGEGHIDSKLAGIDFSKAVKTETLKKGTRIQQWVDNSTGEIGKYFIPEGGGANVGINIENRSLKTFELTEDVKVLKSTAKEFRGNPGGDIQLFNPELKNKINQVD